MNYLDIYKSYLKTVVSKQDRSSLISERSQLNYIGQIKFLSKYFKSIGVIIEDLYCIDDLETLIKLDGLFRDNNELKIKNEKGKNQYSVALHHYIRMITKINDIETYSEEEYVKALKQHYSNEDKDILKLKCKLKFQGQKVVKKYVSVIYRNRSEIVSKITKLRANGFCDLCGKQAPFILENGMPYLETHHLIWMSDNGPDAIWNTVALCPNCHRRVHNLNCEGDLEILKRKIKQYLLVEQELKLIKEFNAYWGEA